MDIINDKCGIYIFTNKKDGKHYVGRDALLHKDNRKKQHFAEAYRPNSRNYNCYFHRAIRKYGKDSWEYRRLFCDVDDMADTEIHYIALLESFGKGYNMTAGGEGSLGLKHTDESKKKMSDAHKGSKSYNWKGGAERLCKTCGINKVYVNPNKNYPSSHCKICSHKIRVEYRRKMNNSIAVDDERRNGICPACKINKKVISASGKVKGYCNACDAEYQRRRRAAKREGTINLDKHKRTNKWLDKAVML